MASFFEKNKRKSALALLLLFLKWRKGLAPLLLIVALLMLMSFAPGNLMGICLAGMARMPGGSHFAAAVTWSASKVGMEIGGVPHQNSYREYVGAFRLAGDQGFAGLLQKRSFKDLIDAFHAARYDRNAALNLLFHNNPTGGSVVPGSGLDMVKQGGALGGDAGGAGAFGMAAKIGGAKSVSGVMSPEEARDAGSGEKGVALDEADLEGERAGMVDSAFAGGLAKMNPDDMLGGSGAYASKAFFGAPGDMGKAGAMGPAAKNGGNGSNIAKFRNGNGAKGGGAKLAQTSRRGGRSMNLGRRGMRNSKALGTLRGMVTLNDQIRNGTSMEDAAGSSSEQWEGSPLTGQQAQLPPAPTSLSGGGGGGAAGGGFGGIPGGIPGGGSYPTGGNIPTYSPGDPGLICTSVQIAQGKVSNGKDCVDPEDFNKSNNQPREDLFNDAANDIWKALGLFAAAAVTVGIGMNLIETGSSCLIIVGIGLVGAGLGMFGSAMGLAGDAIKKGSDLMGEKGGGMDGGLLITTAVSEMVLGVMALVMGFGGAITGNAGALMMVSAIVFSLGALMIGMQQLMGNSSPQTPAYDNPIEDEKEKKLKANADDGQADGLPPPPTDMHYETGPDGKPVLEYNYNTFPPGSDVPPNVATELNTQKGGGDSGLPPAPEHQHYEGLDKDGKPKLVPDYQIGVAQRQDANSFTGGPPTQLPAADPGQHWELTNGGGDPTDPKSWKEVKNYDIPKSDLQQANASKGQQYSQCQNSGPAPDGKHYEGYDCHLVNDYPVN